MKKKLLVANGVTRDGRHAIGGVFRLCETTGVPLPDAVCRIKENGSIVDWPDFYSSALAAGIKHHRIISRVSEACFEAFGADYRDVVISRLEDEHESPTLAR